jgi:hypothetical protein
MTWDRSKHPRWPRGSEPPPPGAKGGRFMSKEHVAGGWAETVSDRVGRKRGEHERARGRDIREEIDYAELDGLVRISGAGRRAGQQDQALAAIYDAQGFHGKPEVVSEAELDRRIANGWIEVWRGFGGPPEGTEYAEAFRSGDRHYAGLGVHGNGTYAASGSDAEYQAGTYTHKVPGSSMEPNRGSLVRMAIPDGANLINMNDIRFVQEVRGDYGIRDPLRAARGRVLSDDGRLAAAMGYDGMALERDGRGIYVIFNRSILAVQEG